VLVIDDFIKDENLINLIKEDKTFFPDNMEEVENIGESNNYFHNGQSSCYAPYMFWDGWLSSSANTLRKKVVKLIWEYPGSLPFPVEDVCGFEYWCRTFKKDQYLGVHVDEDTFAYAHDRTFNAPAYGAIWYGFSECSEGGFLEIHKNKIIGSPENALEKDTVKDLLSNKDERERIAYKPNRLIVFDAGRQFHETTKIISGTRQVMVINVWHKNSPPRALSTGEFFYE
jgi:hypothetical protein